MRRSEFDYIIVGAGSAGCVLANRLSADPSVSVCLVEAGPRDNSIGIRMPAALTLPIESDTYNWKFESEPEQELGGRTIGQARGRGLGGSSSINGMVFARGTPQDYDGWRDFGIDGWSFKDCLPYFKKLETFEAGRDPLRGGSGPISVIRSEAGHPLYQAYIDAGLEFGLRDAGDYNSARADGIHKTQVTIRDGVRCSTSLAYLRPIAERKNLEVLINSQVARVEFSGKAAVGVTLSRHGRTEIIHAAREVILCAGTISTPQILMLSGIGDQTHLFEHDIPLVANVPGVGADLQDHVVAPLRFRSKPGVSLSGKLSNLGRLRLGMEWILRKKGLGATNFFEVGAFFKGSDAVDYYNLQHEFLPFLADFQSGKVEISDGFQYFLSQMRPCSRGSIKLRSGDFRAKPKIRFNYLTDQRDVAEMVDGLRMTLSMVAQSAWNPFRGSVVDAPDATATDRDIAGWLRSVANTEHHPTSTCRMGTDDLAVTDGAGRVRDVDRLRVVDGSILPRVPSGNVNAPIIMVAEKLADAIAKALAPKQQLTSGGPRQRTEASI